MERYDAIIVGAGMVGLVSALALAKENFKVAIIDANPPKTDDNNKISARVSAINLCSQALLAKLGILSKIPPDHTSPLTKMQIWDEIGGGHIEFNSLELNLPQLGLILFNEDIIRAAWLRLSEYTNVSFHHELPQSIVREPKHIFLELKKNKVSAHVLIAADGAHSWVRKTLGIKTDAKPYAQSGIVALIKTEIPHQQCAYQNFLPTGPLGVLPLKNPNEMAIVWSADSDYAHALLDMTEPQFNTALEKALGNKLGHISLISERQAFPLVASHAKQYCQERVALIGDAAHTIHPLAGQGLNLGFMDTKALIEAICEAREKERDIGAFRVLRQYERARKGDNISMLAAMRGFKTLFASQNRGLIQLRNLGIQVLNHFGPLKRIFARKGLGKL